MRSFFSVSAVAMALIPLGAAHVNAGVSIVSIGTAANPERDDGQRAAGQGASNLVEINGTSVRVGNVSSVASDGEGESQIRIESVSGSEGTANATVRVGGHQRTVSIANDQATALYISGTANRITLDSADSLRLISISGVSNLLFVASPINVEELRITGMDNHVHIDQNSRLKSVWAGAGNSVVQY